MISEWLYGLDEKLLYPVIVILIGGSTEVGHWLGLKLRRRRQDADNIDTLTAAALGLLALLLAFSFSLAMSRFDDRRHIVLEEANAIGTLANYTLTLPQAVQPPILDLLHDYAAIRVTLGMPFDPPKLERDVVRSLDLQVRLWKQAATLTTASPQSLPMYRFVVALNEMTNIHEKRLTIMRYHVPSGVMWILVGVAVVAMGFTGYNWGVRASHQRPAHVIMSFMAAILIVLVIDLDRPSRGLIQVSNQALIDAANSIQWPPNSSP